MNQTRLERIAEEAVERCDSINNMYSDQRAATKQVILDALATYAAEQLAGDGGVAGEIKELLKFNEFKVRSLYREDGNFVMLDEPFREAADAHEVSDYLNGLIYPTPTT